jgi:hypothetical protein
VPLVICLTAAGIQHKVFKKGYLPHIPALLAPNKNVTVNKNDNHVITCYQNGSPRSRSSINIIMDHH